MLRLLDDRQLYADKCGAAQRMYAAHPTWDQVAQSWLSVAAGGPPAQYAGQLHGVTASEMTRFIVISGIDGCGKTTVINAIERQARTGGLHHAL